MFAVSFALAGIAVCSTPWCSNLVALNIVMAINGIATSVAQIGQILCTTPQCVNTLRPRQNGRHFADDTFRRIFLNENIGISIKISLKFVPKGPINNIPALVQVMTWR